MTKSLSKLLVLGLLPGTVACGSESPSGLDPLETELVLIQGDGQFAPAGERLSEELVVAVRRLGTQEGVQDIVVEFQIVSGDATLDRRVDVTDEAGTAATGVKLGAELGTARIEARVVDVEIAPVEFLAHAVEAPVLTGVPALLSAGEIVQVEGANFNPVPRNNVVLFDGVRGTVTESSQSSLKVRVPSCLPSREVEIGVRVGSAGSQVLSATVDGSSERLHLERGEVFDLDGTDGSGCLALDPADAGRYLLIAQSAGRIAGARYEVGLRGLGEEPATAALVAAGATPSLPAGAPLRRSAAESWHDRLRLWEEQLVASAPGRTDADAPASTAAVPFEGQERTFRVIGRGSSLSEVEAVARKVGEHAAIFVDRRVEDVIDDGFVSAMSGLFDDPIYGVVTEEFGNHSDIDGNDRVVILFTPEVNLLTDRGDDGFVAGFFFGLDLLPQNRNSNAGEIFYMVTPDPNGTFSDPRLASNLRRQLPPILAHEFQHMVHFNERVLVRGGRGTDALWLSEGLATMAEDRFAAHALKVDDFLGTNLGRAARYLAAPEEVSLTVTAGSGTLAERGAGWLFTRYLWERFGGDILARLTQTTLTGIENVENRTGEEWESLLADWGVAVQREFFDWPTLPSHLGYLGLELERRLSEREQTPAPPETLGNEDFHRSARLWSGGTAYWLLELDGGGGPLALNLGAANGGPVEGAAELRLRLVRVF